MIQIYLLQVLAVTQELCGDLEYSYEQIDLVPALVLSPFGYWDLSTALTLEVMCVWAWA